MEYNIQTAALEAGIRDMCRESGEYLDYVGRRYFVSSDPFGMVAWVWRASFVQRSEYTTQVLFDVTETFTGETSVQDATRYCMDVDGVLV